MLEVGRRAPMFTLKDSDGNDVSLQGLRGMWVIVYFYPKDDTPGCTAEAVEFSALAKEFAEKKAIVVGISKDSVESHDRFRCKHGIGITLLSDPDASVIAAYGVWKQKKRYGRISMGTVRSTFLIDPGGAIAGVWINVKAKGHARDMLKKL
ncbi:MAG: redoxin domain-containing protein [Chitinivibrionales bacterium]|nr:redoxin domain-containing protein [Chitinivibrionales bacterium]MBD3396472.1 redoxin domain-containing protein [Chitinivibrionales bacterium]